MSDSAPPVVAEKDKAPELIPLVRSFVSYFQRYVTEGNVTEIHSIYENSFNKLTERFYKNSSWPRIEQVADLLGPSELPHLLYRELFYRHIYSRLSPSLDDRIESWNNYLELFSFLSQQQHKLRFPHVWLFDLVDEFVWQAQSFNHYRAKVKALSAADRQTLASEPELWSALTVIQTLQKIVDRSKVAEYLASNKAERLGEGEGNDYRAFGYFASVGLLRVHAMLGDYHSALLAINHVRMMSDTDENLFCSSVTSCHISLYYYTGFSYLMMRRYADATSCFSSILLFLARAKQQARTAQWEQHAKKQDQMLALLALSWCLSASRPLDGLVDELLRSKHADHLTRLRKGQSAAFEELFVSACPKFLSPHLPSLSDASSNTNLHLEPLRYQQSVFLSEVRQQAMIPVIRSYLKLYSSISTAKLASFLGVGVPELRSLLLAYKARSRAFIWRSGPPISGSWTTQLAENTDFHMDGETMVVTENRASPSYIVPLLDGINKLKVKSP